MCLILNSYRGRVVWICRHNFFRFWFVVSGEEWSLKKKGGYVRRIRFGCGLDLRIYGITFSVFETVRGTFYWTCIWQICGLDFEGPILRRLSPTKRQALTAPTVISENTASCFAKLKSSIAKQCWQFAAHNGRSRIELCQFTVVGFIRNHCGGILKDGKPQIYNEGCTNPGRQDQISIWVRVLTVPMHLGLINGPSVPHNLISAQGSPVLC